MQIILFSSNSDDSKQEYVFTYSQYGSPTGGVLHGAPFLQGFGLHDGKPALIQTHTSHTIHVYDHSPFTTASQAPRSVSEIEKILGKEGVSRTAIMEQSPISSLRQPQTDVGLFLSTNPQIKPCKDLYSNKETTFGRSDLSGTSLL